ncbi:UBX domain-containing protein 7 [Sparganum proliferum]
MSSNVDEFCAITGCNSATATSFLTVCNNDLQMAVNMYISDPSAVPVDASPEYRLPIPQRTERLIPMELPQYIPSSRRATRSAFSASTRSPFDDSPSDSGSDGDDVVDLCSPSENGTVSSTSTTIESNHQTGNHQAGDSNDTHSAATTSHTTCLPSSAAVPSTTEASLEQNGGTSHRAKKSATSAANRRKKGILRQLFAPPTDLFKGSLREAYEAARRQKKWLLLSLHEEACFDCHILNRDVWKDYRVADLIKRNFVFVQVDVNSPDGVMYRTRHSYINSATQICILNPVTGEQEVMWNHVKDPTSMHTILTEFLLHTPFPGDSPRDTSPEGLASSGGLSRLRRTHARDSSSDPPSKRPRGNEVSSLSSHLASVSFTPSDSELEVPVSPGFTVLDLTEEEQLQMALQASAAETAGCSSSSGPVNTSSTSASAADAPSPKLSGEAEAGRQHRRNNTNGVTDANSVETSPGQSSPTEDCVIVSVDLNSAATASSSSASLTTSSFHLPKPSDPAQALRIALRLPSGTREVLELDPNMHLSTLNAYGESLGYPCAIYEFVRVYPRLRLAHLPPETPLRDSGLLTNDTLFLQER